MYLRKFYGVLQCLMATRRKTPPKRSPDQATLTISLPKDLKEQPDDAGRRPDSATVYRLKLASPLWHRPAYTKWQESRNFEKALAKAAELGVTATVESQNVKGEATPATRQP